MGRKKKRRKGKEKKEKENKYFSEYIINTTFFLRCWGLTHAKQALYY